MAKLSNAENPVRKAGSRVVDTLGSQTWLDRPSYRLEHVLTLTFACLGRYRERVGNVLHGTWLGHPLHPVLAALPAGAAATTLVLDAASALPSRKKLSDASQYALGVGILASLGALVTGVADWQHTHEQSRRIGLVHGVSNLVATALYAKSFYDRRHGRRARGMATSTVGYGITLASGYLGGELVYGSGAGVDRSGPRLTLETWTPVLPVTALDGRPRRVEVDGIGVVLFRNGGQIMAVGAQCPHLGAPMCDGWIDQGRIVCPWHGSHFAYRSGMVLRGPATAALPSYPTRIRNGLVEVRGGSS
ncbi:(2Fe-2S)-binding protein [Mycobacterium sp. 852002-51163_SCH5372311]|uniref:Rieske 2Fe-2S domain-containing protein n=1 Tax=Mycobacterium sp. 852002-51163_SCH5372311 TaxID=1834097 RepID=UPI000801196E|nr:Rieske 2Fe-2S domain-containing protein [Mycobacterium sp. 852002-51163_SCH5372311]OBF85312.1 (2Fe-2S)-binding protein [Mycobacterium sp. 852002-51163_SCH5372311]